MGAKHGPGFTDTNFESEVAKASTPVLVGFLGRMVCAMRAPGSTIDSIAGR